MFTSEQYQDRLDMLCLAHHMTSVANLKEIFQENALLPYARMKSRAYENLASEEVQERRALKVVPEGNQLHDYVPLYFSYKTPMAAKRQDRNCEWVYLTFQIDLIANDIPGIAVSDGNAASNDTVLKLVRSLDDFAIVDAKAVYKVRYGHDQELGRKKSAELLVPERLPLDYLLSITVFDESVANKVKSITQSFKRAYNLRIDAGWYFVTRTQPDEGKFFE